MAFGFEKALDKRGLSAEAMHEVVRMWLWILEDELYESAEKAYSDYVHYGLPQLKKVAVKYGFPNEIGDNYGNEAQYSE